MQFFLRKNLVLDLLLGLLGSAHSLFGSVVPLAGLDAELLWSRHLDFQVVKAAIELQVLWRKGQKIGILRRRIQLLEAFVQIVVVLEERASGGIRQLREHISVR